MEDKNIQINTTERNKSSNKWIKKRKEETIHTKCTTKRMSVGSNIEWGREKERHKQNWQRDIRFASFKHVYGILAFDRPLCILNELTQNQRQHSSAHRSKWVNNFVSVFLVFGMRLLLSLYPFLFIVALLLLLFAWFGMLPAHSVEVCVCVECFDITLNAIIFTRTSTSTRKNNSTSNRHIVKEKINRALLHAMTIYRLSINIYNS